MSFDWVRFFDRYGIDYVEAGANVKRGEVNIACPWCGDDPSHHMGVRSDTGWYSCWRGRGQGHAGKSPQRLIMKLIRCSRTEADAIVGRRSRPLDDLEAGAQRLLDMQRPSTHAPAEGPLEWPDDIVPLDVESRVHQHAVDYLEGRGYTRRDIRTLATEYGLRFGLAGKFAGRIVVPVEDHVDGHRVLVGWTARSIYPRATLRYLSLPTDPDSATRLGCAPARVNIKHVVYLAPGVEEGGRVLVITEGPFDALRVDLYARRHDVRATCLFSLDVSEAQVFALDRIARAFDDVVVMTDEGADVAARIAERRLAHMCVRAVPTPGAEDPGAMTRAQISALCASL